MSGATPHRAKRVVGQRITGRQNTTPPSIHPSAEREPDSRPPSDGPGLLRRPGRGAHASQVEEVRHKTPPPHEHETGGVPAHLDGWTDAPPDLEEGQAVDLTPPEVLQLTPITIDGATALKVQGVDERLVSKQLAGLLASVRDPRGRAARSADARTNARHFLPMPRPSWAPDGWKERVALEAWTRGSTRQTIEAFCDGHFHLSLDLQRGTATVQLKARALWALGGGAEGYARLAAWVLPALHAHLFANSRARLLVPDVDADEQGQVIERGPVELDEQNALRLAKAAGWRVRNVELCVDSVGLGWSPTDVHRFTGRQKNGMYPETGYMGRGEQAETIWQGRRSSPCSLMLYNKTRQIEARKDNVSGSVCGSTYHPSWRAAGWRGQQVNRVEFRLNGYALLIENKATGDVLDLTDPAQLADTEALAKAWRYHAMRRRLVLPDRSRKERCTVDPRWRVVQNFADMKTEFDATEWRQHRAVQREAVLTMYDRARRSAIRALLRIDAMMREEVKPAPRRRDPMTGKRGEYLEQECKLLAHERLGRVVHLLADDLSPTAAGEALDYAANWRAGWEPFLGPDFAEMARASRPVPLPAWLDEGSDTSKPAIDPRLFDAWGFDPQTLLPRATPRPLAPKMDTRAKDSAPASG